jgi:MFS transporter, DHA1 family, multidrug resistance protein
VHDVRIKTKVSAIGPCHAQYSGAGAARAGQFARLRSAEYGFWFAVTSLGYMSGNFTASRLSQRFGVDAMIIAAFELIGATLTVAFVAGLPDAGPAIIFLPQMIIS